MSRMRRFWSELGITLLSLMAGAMSFALVWLFTVPVFVAFELSERQAHRSELWISARGISSALWAVSSVATMWVWQRLHRSRFPREITGWHRSPVILGLIALVWAVIPPYIYFTAQKTLWKETRRPWQPHAHALDTTQQTFAIRQYRFYSMLVLEFTNERPRYTSRFEFPAREIDKIDSVNWFNGGNAVRIELEYTFQNSACASGNDAHEPFHRRFITDF